MKAGPKAAVDETQLPFCPRSSGAARFAAFCEKFVLVTKGTRALSPLRLRDWQRDLIGSVEDADPTPRTAGWMLPRGQGKSTLVAAYGLYKLFLGGEGAVVCVVAVDERQAGIVFGIARRMVELDDELSSRCQVFKERLHIPVRDAHFHCLPAEPKRLEGLDYSLAILDEAGVANRDSYEVLTLAQGKREQSTLIAIGTPGPDPNNQCWLTYGTMRLTIQTTSRLCGASSRLPGLRTTPLTASTAGSWPTRRSMTFCTVTQCMLCCRPRHVRRRSGELGCVSSPPTQTAHSYRLAFGTGCQLAGGYLTAPRSLLHWMVRFRTTRRHCWLGPCPLNHISTQSRFGSDTTAMTRTGCRSLRLSRPSVMPAVAGGSSKSVATHIVGRAPCRLWRPNSYRSWNSCTPQARLTAATGDLYSAAVNGRISHSGDRQLAEHVVAAVIVEDARGIRLSKASRSRAAKKIDLAACLVMAHSRATWRATHKKRKRAYSFK